ncbi:DUF1648 domain-containing protein [Cellulomonas denverensis]|uniref:DUF1648 domain-containing protein n=1 Tax=Cellulomonas denverensis TaxID=264297 RepID=A0A7X6KVJ3_9CELL|nr:DUF1648 domain-containing protein [Cellulomonas denverensis]NKY22744.1 DUF1648 domain-containing protein [Cellulomonas denverensis]GIG26208.1 hypothetical protein Cde04nite_24520 [Cellulomonas denverensis]
MRHRRSTTLIGLLPSLVILGAAGLIAWSWRDQLPDPIATHFSADGPDRFGSLGGFIALMLGVFTAVAISAWLVALMLGLSSSTRRIGVGVAVGMSGFGAALLLGFLNAGRGLADAQEMGSVNSVVVIAGLIGLGLGALAAWAVPGDPAQPAHGKVTGPRLALGENERAVWRQQVTSRIGQQLGGWMTVLIVVLAIVLQFPAMLLIAAVLAVLLVGMTVIQVTVDATGLHLRSAAGRPRLTVPVTEITGVEVQQVNALREFGGWGIRVGRQGQLGWVMRNGEGIRVHRTGDRDLVVTVPDAATGAALLATLAQRARESGSPED